MSRCRHDLEAEQCDFCRAAVRVAARLRSPKLKRRAHTYVRIVRGGLPSLGKNRRR